MPFNQPYLRICVYDLQLIGSDSGIFEDSEKYGQYVRSNSCMAPFRVNYNNTMTSGAEILRNFHYLKSGFDDILKY